LGSSYSKKHRFLPAVIIHFYGCVRQKAFNSSTGALKVYIHVKFLTSHILIIPAISAVMTYGLLGRHLTPTNG